MQEAYTAFDIFLNQVLHLRTSIRLAKMSAYDHSAAASLEATLAEYSTYLGQWSSHLDSYISRPPRRWKDDSITQSVLDLKVLRIWVLVAKIMLLVPSGDVETAWDSYTDEFRDITDLADSVINQSITRSVLWLSNCYHNRIADLNIFYPFS